MRPVKTQLEIIKQGTVDVIPEDLLIEKLERSLKNEAPLLVKQGFDPTAPDIHLGHTVGLKKLKQFQDLGHQVCFLVGDFTGLIGDPSGRSDTRVRMSQDELAENAKTYTEQAFKILDREKTIIEFNSRWLAKLNFAEVLELASTQTVARMLERDDFEKRFKSQKPISLLEFVYPLAQGFDSVALKADVELGGTDQRFNLLMAREIQKNYGQEPQVIVTMPLLEGTDGVEKMSKSLGNYIGITDPPDEIFGKTMSIPDELIAKYFELVSSKTPEEVRAVRRRLGDPKTNPSHLKRELAKDLITQYYDADLADEAETHFDRIHVEHEVPDEIEHVSIEGDAEGLWIVDALAESKLCKSKSDARRMIQQGAVSIDGEKVTDIELRLAKQNAAYTVKVGKRRFVSIRVV
ncbi:MAG: tyrosine--tRNA ligase [Candidatus Latescibacterota bacterium]|nr:MAG: tyrosine--tRNA ligase [Candidatus Latescibacterota bacterium]